MTQGDSSDHRVRVAIIGAGFGGLSAAKALRHAPFDVIVIDGHNYHLFQPLLYQVATAALSPSDITSPTRSMLRDQKNTIVVLGQVSHIDLERKQVVAEEIRIDFDYLVVASGAQQSYFGHDEWAAYAPGLNRSMMQPICGGASCWRSKKPRWSLIQSSAGASSTS